MRGVAVELVPLCRDLASGVPLDSRFGSYEGFDTIASTAPVDGSIATTAPGCDPRARAAAACSFASIVVTTAAPCFGRPRTRSANVCAASSGASPFRYGFIACSSSVRPYTNE